MKTSLQIRSLRTAGLALTLGLGLAAASHSAQAAIVQITLGADYTRSFTTTQFNNMYADITKDGIADRVGSYSEPGNAVLWNSFTEDNQPINMLRHITKTQNTTGGNLASFQDTRINANAWTTGFVETAFTVSGFENSTSTITLTRLVFDDASLTLPSGFTPSSSNYPEFGSTAVPEPGTFIPAAVLVAGAVLRRRRSRSHRSGRATA